MKAAAGVACLLLAATTASACGKKGPPLPPLVRVPVAPADFTAERRDGNAELYFTVPATNTDGTRPANIERLDVYAFTGGTLVSDEQFLKLGMRIASVQVKAPRNPNAVVEPDDPDDDLEPLVGSGQEQGARVHVSEDVSRLASVASTSGEVPVRSYVGVGISTRGRKGVFSRRVAVTLGAPPTVPAQPQVSYDEKGVTVAWTPVALSPSTQGVHPAMAYHVYEIATSPATGRSADTRVTGMPVTDAQFVSTQIEWGAERCYAVRSVEVRDGLSAESGASPSACVKFTDTFAPMAPTGLIAVPSEAAINLTWDANVEKDLSGYVVLRGTAADSPLAPITSAPISETTFRDLVPPGGRYFYAVQATDKSGNASPASGRVDATAR